MDRALKIFAAFVAATVSAAARGAAPAPPEQAADTSSIILAPKPASATQSSPVKLAAAASPVSPAIAAEISAGMAAYSPEPYAAQAPVPDLRDVDKPRNLIPRVPAEMLQKFVVHESRLPVFRPRDLYAKAGLIDLSFREHPGLHIGNFFNLNAGAAYEKMIDEQLWAARQDLADTAVAMAIGGDAGEIGVAQESILDESRFSWWPQRPGANLTIP